MPIYMDRIEEFLVKVEGPQQLQGYIPSYVTTGGTTNYKGDGDPSLYDPMGVSGVTIATGVDLGQTDVGTLTRLGIEGELLEKLRPYIGHSDKDAVYALHNNKLYVTKEEADKIDNAMHHYHADIISARYDKEAGNKAFENLPWQAQTAIYSLLYQRGTGSPSKYPNTWSSLVNKDWEQASKDLHDGALWTYDSRRAMEGDLLDDLIKELETGIVTPPTVEPTPPSITPEEDSQDSILTEEEQRAQSCFQLVSNIFEVIDEIYNSSLTQKELDHLNTILGGMKTVTKKLL